MKKSQEWESAHSLSEIDVLTITVRNAAEIGTHVVMGENKGNGCIATHYKVTECHKQGDGYALTIAKINKTEPGKDNPLVKEWFAHMGKTNRSEEWLREQLTRGLLINQWPNDMKKDMRIFTESQERFKKMAKELKDDARETETKTNEMRAKVSQVDRAVKEAAELMGEIVKKWDIQAKLDQKGGWPVYKPYYKDGLKRLAKDFEQEPTYIGWDANNGPFTNRFDDDFLMETTKQQVENGKAMTATSNGEGGKQASISIEWRNEYPILTELIKNLAQEGSENEKRALKAEESALNWQHVAGRRDDKIKELYGEQKHALEQRDAANERSSALVDRINEQNEHRKEMAGVANAMLKLLISEGRNFTPANFKRFKKTLENFCELTKGEKAPF